MKERTRLLQHAALKRMTLLLATLAIALLPVLAAYASSKKDIGKDRAKQTALKDAGTKADKVKKMKCSWDDDDGGCYEISFRKGNYNYEYTVLSGTGAVAEMEQKIRKIGKESGKQALSRKKARRIALKDAGLKTASKIRIKKTSYRKARIWEVKFRAGGMEYEYKIGRYTGRIFEKEKEHAGR